MSTDFNIKPIGASVAAPLPGPAPAAAKAAVPTQLPADKAVTAPDSSVTVRNNAKADTTRAQAESNHLSRQTLIDDATSQIIFRVTDNRTHLVVRQTPDESRLRLRAYFRAQDVARLDKARGEGSQATPTDRTA